MNPEEDLTLETLLVVRGEVAPALDESVLRQCYLVQKRFQFTEDRSVSSTAMERLIDKEVEKHVSHSQGSTQ